MKISVIIPVYNGEKWVAQCVRNMLCQTFRELEIIVVDDGSTDGTARIAREFALRDPRVKVIGQPNQGLAVTRNTGIDAATGDYLHFMDVDDLVGTDYYARMAEAVALTGADMAYGGMLNEAKAYASIEFSDRLLVSTFEDKIAIPGSAVSPSACRYLIKRTLIEEHGLRFEPGLLIEDLPFTLQAVAAAGSIVTVPGANYHYRRRADSILTRRDREFVRERERHFQQVRAFRREFLRTAGIDGHVAATLHLRYKLLGVIKIHKIYYNDGSVKWFMGRVRLAKRQGIRL